MEVIIGFNNILKKLFNSCLLVKDDMNFPKNVESCKNSSIKFRYENGIDTLDTAQGYGDSEKVLSQFDLNSFKVVTKLIGDAKLETSLDNLKLSSVYALMFHRENECTDETWKQFESYKSQGMVKKI